MLFEDSFVDDAVGFALAAFYGAGLDELDVGVDGEDAFHFVVELFFEGDHVGEVVGVESFFDFDEDVEGVEVVFAVDDELVLWFEGLEVENDAFDL